MSITVTAVKARQNLGELLNLVSIKHEEVIIERAGKKIARLTAIEGSAVNEPVAEIYRVQKKKPRNEPLDYNPDVVDPEFEKPGITLAEKIRKERDEWVKADPDVVREEIERFRSSRGVGKEMWEATGLTPDEYVRREREEWDESERRRVPMASSNEDGSN